MRKRIKGIILQAIVLGLFSTVIFVILVGVSSSGSLLIAILLGIMVAAIYGYGMFAALMISDWFARDRAEFPKRRKVLWLLIILVYRNGVDLYFENVVTPSLNGKNGRT